MSFGFSLCCATVALALFGGQGAQCQPRQDRAWKHYVDKETGFCVSYPSRWIRNSGREDRGLFVTTGVTRYSMPIALLDVSTVADTATDVGAVPVSLAADYRSHVEGLEKFIRVSQVHTLDRREFAINGIPALFTRTQYADSKERSDWMEAIVLLHRNGLLYRLELQSQAGSWSRFGPMFQHFVDSFQVDCLSR